MMSTYQAVEGEYGQYHVVDLRTGSVVWSWWWSFDGSDWYVMERISHDNRHTHGLDAWIAQQPKGA